MITATDDGNDNDTNNDNTDNDDNITVFGKGRMGSALMGSLRI